jgi:hypothetical protein
VDTVIEGVIAPLLQSNEPVNPEAVRTELVQLSVTDTAGAAGIAFGLASPAPAVLLQPFTVCVTVYIPAVATVIDDVVAPVLHNRLPVKPEAVSSELPQLSVTDTTGAGTFELFGAATPLPEALVHPLIDCVTV